MVDIFEQINFQCSKFEKLSSFIDVTATIIISFSIYLLQFYKLKCWHRRVRLILYSFSLFSLNSVMQNWNRRPSLYTDLRVNSVSDSDESLWLLTGLFSTNCSNSPSNLSPFIIPFITVPPGQMGCRTVPFLLFFELVARLQYIWYLNDKNNYCYDSLCARAFISAIKKKQIISNNSYYHLRRIYIISGNFNIILFILIHNFIIYIIKLLQQTLLPS